MGFFKKWMIFGVILFGAGIINNYLVSGQATGPDAWENYQDSFQPPEKVMKAIGVKPGMTIGEIGAGRGRYAVKLAAKVGVTGKVYANDILESKLAYLRHRCNRDNINNIVGVLGKVTDPLFPQKSLDMAFMVNTYHHINDQVGLMKNLLPSLKEHATLVIVEAEPKKAGGWGSHATKKSVLIGQMEVAGFALVKTETFLPKDNIYIFRAKKN